jgi:hypothetical protein
MRLVNVRPYGCPLYVHHVLDASFDNLDLVGGFYALANLPIQSNYTLLINRCQFSAGAGDAAVYLNTATARMTDCEIHNGGRAVMRLRETNLFVNGLFIAGCNVGCQFSIMRTHAGSTGGGQITLRQVNQDVENGPFALRAAIMLEAGPTESFVRLEEVSAGETPGVPFLFLDSSGTGPNWAPNIITADNAIPWLNSVSSYVLANGTKWTGEFKNMGLGQSPHLIQLGTYASGNPFKFRDLTYTAPPHGGSWYAGPHRLEVPTPVDAQFQEWRCAQTGTYGTQTPPVWKGVNPIQATSQSLASYALDHTVAATTAYGGSSYGWYCDAMTSSALQTIVGGWGGSDTSTPSGLRFRLATQTPLKTDMAPPEPTGSGYVRVSLANNLTNFPAASAGTKSNGVAITWPTLSAAITGVVGISVTDQDDRPIAYVQFATTQTFASGSTPTIPIGGFTLVQTPLAAPQGGLTQYGWGRIADRYLGGVALTPPSTWYVGLNTAHASASASPTEPSGNAYARAALANDPGHWSSSWGRGAYISGWNGVAATFAAPTGAGWGTILGSTLFDATTAGNCWFVGDAPNPVATGAGLAPTIAPGALLVSI